MHAFANDLERPIGTYLYGRRMYEVMMVWEHAETFADQHPVTMDYAQIWQAADRSCTRRRSERSPVPGQRHRTGLRPGRGPAAEGVRLA